MRYGGFCPNRHTNEYMSALDIQYEKDSGACAYCQGEGSFPRESRDSDDDDTDQTEICPRCKGSGCAKLIVTEVDDF